ncbi:hypothetical protein BN3590_03111 [Clostridium sp. C105KSO15]|nr:hypothetical protein BN3590_03111 [Clostridium sp. C105KSO15]
MHASRVGRGVEESDVFFFKQKTAYEIMPSLVGSEMCIRDKVHTSDIVAAASVDCLQARIRNN